ncbi:MAG: RecB family endonuclease NucS, partial [Oceanospirillaceae bacterium]
MFKIDQTSNRISRLQSKSFSELGFTERNHLQEWLAYQPDAFGEELLIIQKEFDGFDDTRERLDLLALDKDGNLVVIENKLDDTGRDVIWQALKYASYCSSLNKKQIVEIFQSYLNRFCGLDAQNSKGGEAKQDANALIC